MGRQVNVPEISFGIRDPVERREQPFWLHLAGGERFVEGQFQGDQLLTDCDRFRLHVQTDAFDLNPLLRRQVQLRCEFQDMGWPRRTIEFRGLRHAPTGALEQLGDIVGRVRFRDREFRGFLRSRGMVQCLLGDCRKDEDCEGSERDDERLH